jgi:3-phenylpropionate/trans-cinnamate dioxygenase ferredoxin reductase subunit
MRIAIVGGGLAAVKAIEELRDQGHDGEIALYGAEPYLPYERPPLSKGVLLGKDQPDSVFVHDEAWFDEHGVDLHLGVEVVGLDLDRHELDTGSRTASRTASRTGAFDQLLIATGATPRHLEAADRSGAPVAYLRTIDDSRSLKAAFGPGLRVVIIGAGWIGLEVASAAIAAGSDVTVIETLSLPLLRVLGADVAQVFADLHRSHGVDLRLGASITGITREGSRVVVELEDGRVAGDQLVVGVGVAPNTGLAESAGLAVADGILVDERLRTADRAVFAAGDVANHQHPVLGRRLRVEHWDTAIQHGRHVARTMLGADAAYERMPYFYTDQYDLGMEYVGSVGPDGPEAQVLRGDLEGRNFTAFWLAAGRVVAGMHVNDWDAIDPIKALVGKQIAVDRLADESISLADLAAG